MSGLCGWIDSSPESGLAPSILTDMLASEAGNDLSAERPILSGAGAINVLTGSAGPAHFILDVNGYFR